MLQDAPNLNHLWAQLVVEELVRNGVTWFCVSPGSRSTPLAWAVSSHSKAQPVVHFDERGAAFHALGIAKATGTPAIFVCTSGTAVANAYPAVVEAYMSEVPLILLTADRPPELQDVGANQTIRQPGIFGNYTRWDFAFPRPAEPFRPAGVLTAIDQACFRAVAPTRGPVHLNCPFGEPLAPVHELETQNGTAALEDCRHWVNDTGPFTRYETSTPRVDEAAAQRLAERLLRSKRGVVLVGQLQCVAEREGVAKFAAALHWPVVPDVTSGMRLNALHPLELPHAHHFAADLLNEADAVVHVGGAITSRPILDALDGLNLFAERRVDYVRVAAGPSRLDPYHNVACRVVCDPGALAEALAPRLPRRERPPWADPYIARNGAVDDVLKRAFPAADPVNEMSVAYWITREAPRLGTLLLGNSMPIRDADLYGCAEGNGPLVAANRGASGIDGTIATAAGYARALGQPVTAIIGDLAALHDLNSLALLRDLPAPVILVVINNNGGGIFHFLPIAEYPEHFEQFFGTPHGIRFDAAANLFGLPHRAPETNAGLVDAYRDALAGRRSVIIEVETSRAENRRLHGELDERIQRALDNV